ncbi:MAG TPA: hypothetical protein VLV15_03290 [Dongiaceae bacterium]|nr:hypothetical protein [Dongiaceae bacterium]
MRPRTILHLLLPWCALLVMSCASADQLARQSDQALARGDLRGAYEKARRALDKEPGNANARNAFAAAAGQMSDTYKSQILSLAQTDTLGAARTVLDFRELQSQISRYPVELAPDPAYVQAETRILAGAARLRYDAGRQALATHRPKEAWRCFTECMGFDPHYRDVASRIDDAYQRAITRVAVLPFENQIDVPGLAEVLQQDVAGELSRRSASPAFQFTRVLSPEEVERGMTVAESRGLDPVQARALGRTLSADRVVCGRLSALRSNSDVADWRFPVYHLVSGQNSEGQRVDTWVATDMHVVSRRRHVQLSCTYEVLDVRTGAVLAIDTHAYEAWARVVWSDFVADDDLDHYRLAPPDAGQPDADRAQREWDDHVGGMSLHELLEHTRDHDRGGDWNDRYRGEFSRDTRDHPVCLGGLPPESDMAHLALEGAWQPVLDALRALDPQD